MHYPKTLLEWLRSLPPDDYTREAMIAERNLTRIQNHLNRKA